MAATAMLVGLAKALAVGDPFGAVAAPAERPTATLIAVLVLSVLAGLAASGVVLKLGRSAFDGGFFARCGVTVLGLCLGGAILGGSFWVVGSLLSYAPGPSQSPESGVLFLVYATLAYGSIGTGRRGVGPAGRPGPRPAPCSDPRVTAATSPQDHDPRSVPQPGLTAPYHGKRPRRPFVGVEASSRVARVG